MDCTLTAFLSGQSRTKQVLWFKACSKRLLGRARAADSPGFWVAVLLCCPMPGSTGFVSVCVCVCGYTHMYVYTIYIYIYAIHYMRTDRQIDGQGRRAV